ncbi:Rubrerythrin [Citrifermentans bremense]|uniref:Rubrerythrin n=1 Tax=Citrifermentans bremense TaxID=60035 RepID=A0A6S6M5V9_9BACT|nr:ferritin family protein [Citrifermentans bremense]BCG49073.1 Rubrerythrin [Citrifermentans bremense]
MFKEYTLQEALKLAIKTEKESMDFYRKAASIAKDEGSKKVFTLLAGEEAGHLKAFFDHYKGRDLGDLESFMASPPDRQSATHQALEQSIAEGTGEQKALEIALKEEKSCVDFYTILVKDIVDPLVRRVFETVIRETQGHHDMIEDEYMRVMTMVHSSDQNIYVRE